LKEKLKDKTCVIALDEVDKLDKNDLNDVDFDLTELNYIKVERARVRGNVRLFRAT